MRANVFAFALVTSVFTSGAAMAAQATGVVNVSHVNLDVGGGRTGCIQFVGAGLPNGWGCVYRVGSGALSNLNTQFINDLLREAAHDTKTCQVFWNVLDSSGFARIFAAENATVTSSRRWASAAGLLVRRRSRSSRALHPGTWDAQAALSSDWAMKPSRS